MSATCPRYGPSATTPPARRTSSSLAFPNVATNVALESQRLFEAACAACSFSALVDLCPSLLAFQSPERGRRQRSNAANMTSRSFSVSARVGRPAGPVVSHREEFALVEGLRLVPSDEAAVRLLRRGRADLHDGTCAVTNHSARASGRRPRCDAAKTNRNGRGGAERRRRPRSARGGLASWIIRRRVAAAPRMQRWTAGVVLSKDATKGRPRISPKFR